MIYVRNSRVLGNFRHAHVPASGRGIQQSVSHRVLCDDINVSWEWRCRRRNPWLRERLVIAAGSEWDVHSRPDVSAWMLPPWVPFSAATAIYSILSADRPVLIGDGKQMGQDHVDALFFNLVLHRCDEEANPALCKVKVWMARIVYQTMRRIDTD